MRLKLLPQCQEWTYSVFQVHALEAVAAVLEVVADVKEAAAEAAAVVLELEEPTAKTAAEVALRGGLSPAVKWVASLLCWAQGHYYPSGP